MLAPNLRPKPCQHCGSTFTPVRQLQAVCGVMCAKRKVAADRKAEKQEIRRRKEAIKSLAQVKAETQKAINAYRRVLDAGKPCISCGKPWQDSFQAGHYRSRGAAPHLALDLRNLAGQCVQCNLHLHGNQAAMRKGLIARDGEESVLALEADDAPRHWTREELITLKVFYNRKTKVLKESQR